MHQRRSAHVKAAGQKRRLLIGRIGKRQDLALI
jgi:hypothetical protein